MAESARPLEELLLVPAFCGLVLPTGILCSRAILGLTPQVGKEELVRERWKLWLLRWETLYG